MENSIFRFIWRYSKNQQLIIMAMTLAFLPFLYLVLDLPKYIINDAISGKSFPKVLFGFEFNQIEYLLLLCAALLALLVLIAFFSMKINTFKGVSSERLMRRLRYQLYESILHFPTRHFQRVTPPELSAMITAEVEPMGDFISDSFSLPVVQGGTMLTILFYMISENPLLGLVAISMVPVQAWLIPKLQRKVNLLGRDRVIRARKLAGWVGESVQGISDIHANDTSTYMQASISDKLGGIFNVRYELYRRKFFMKGLNVFLSQLTPLFFYSIGGILVINGELTLGALVAVLAAYNRFTTPWKMLLRYYQRLNDVNIKYEQLVEQFQPSEMLDPARLKQRPETIPRLKAPLEIRNVRLVEEGIKVLEDVTIQIKPGDNIAIVAEPGTRDKFAQLIARLIDPDGGTISVGETNFAALPEAVTGAGIGYAGLESYIFSGTVEDNLLYGVKHAPVTNGKMINVEQFNYIEAVASGNSVHEMDADWINYESLGLSDETELKDWLLTVIRAVELDTFLINRSLSMGLDVEKNPELAQHMMKARHRIASELSKNPESAELIRPFKFDQYNANASVAANLVFGESVNEEFEFKTLGRNTIIREVLDECELTDRFLTIGYELANTLIEMFGNMSADQPLFESFSFVDEETLQKLKTLTTNVTHENVDTLEEEEKTLLISLTFQLVVDRHRFGFIDDDMQELILKARRTFRDKLPVEKRDAIAFFDQEQYNSHLSNRDNLLMGRINYTINKAEQKLNDIIFEVLEKMGITDNMILYATSSPVGVGGSRLAHSDRQKVALARSLIKKPDIFVFNDALSSLDREAQERIRRNMFDLLPNTTFVIFFSEMPDSAEFEQVLSIHEGRITERYIEHRKIEVMPVPTESDEAVSEEHDDGASPLIINEEASALAKIPALAGLSQNRLKLLAFSSRRINFAPGDNLIHEGEPGQFAYVILDGEIDVIIGTGEKENVVTRYGKDNLVGEMALLNDALTSATVRASTPVTALRIEKEVFLKLMEDDSLFALKVATWLSDKLAATTKRLDDAA
jgi:ABC-type multidrug transport system fused ATPase/permease subunit